MRIGVARSLQLKLSFENSQIISYFLTFHNLTCSIQPLSVRCAAVGDDRQVREGGADAAVPRGDPRGDRAVRGTRQERHDDAVEAHPS